MWKELIPNKGIMKEKQDNDCGTAPGNRLEVSTHPDTAELANSKLIVLKYNMIVVELYWILRQSADPRIVREWITQSPP